MYDSMNEAWRDILWKLLEYGEPVKSRDGDSIELLGYSFSLRSIEFALLTEPARKLKSSYAAAEILWYLSGENRIDRVVAYAPQYERFAENGVAHGAYGFRWCNDIAFEAIKGEMIEDLTGKTVATQVSAAIQLLHDKPETRQCVITMYSPMDLLFSILGNRKDIPCTLGLQFIVRRRRLHCVAYMRSNDVWLGTPYDVFAFTSIQRLIADAVKLKLGTYTHHVGSLHLYERNFEKARAIAASSPVDPKPLETTRHAHPVSQRIRYAVDAESALRRGKYDEERVERELGSGTLLMNLVNCCAHKWIAAPGPITSPALLENLR